MNCYHCKTEAHETGKLGYSTWYKCPNCGAEYLYTVSIRISEVPRVGKG